MWAAWLSFLRNLFRPTRVEQELDQEIGAALATLAEEKMQAGMSPAQAWRAARLELGGEDQVKERVREVRRGRLLEEFGLDLRYGWRLFVREPGLNLVAVLTLALGIGTTTSLFSVINSVLLQPLPYANAERLALVVGELNGDRETPYPVSVPDAQDLLAQSASVEQLAWFEDERTLTVTSRDEPLRLHANFVTPVYFNLLGVEAWRGRVLLPEESSALGAHPVAVLSYSLWQRLYGGDDAALGQSIELNGRPYTIVGVLPAEFRDLSSAQHPTDIWVPFTMLTEIFPPRVLTERIFHFFGVVARIEPGAQWSAAQAQVDAVSRRLDEAYPDSNRGYAMRLIPLREKLVGDLRAPLVSLLIGAGFLLLIACANVANLLLARAANRRREMAVRLALGASQGRLLKQLLTEGLLLTSLAALVGFGLAFWTTGHLVRLSGIRLPGFIEIQPDVRVLVFTMLVSLLTGLAFALVPASESSRVDLRETLHQGGRQAGGVHRGGFVHKLLITSQVATAMTLLVGAGLLLQSFRQLHRAGIGFRTENVLTLRLELPSSRYPDSERLRLFSQETLEALHAVPGVVSAHFWGPEMPGQAAWYLPFVEEGRVAASMQDAIIGRIHYVTPGALTQLGFRFREGRDLSEEDRDNTEVVAVVSRSLADRLWPGGDAIGKSFHAFQGTRSYRTIGVVEDGRLGGRVTRDAPNQADAFFSYQQAPRREVSILIQTHKDPTALVPAVRETLRAVDPNLPPYDVMSMRARLGHEEASFRFTAFVGGFFAVTALFLAALGLYAVLAYLASRRTNEIGIRMALGAQPVGVFWLVVGRSLLPTLAGMGVGLFAAFALTRFLSTLLFGVSPLDPSIYLFVVALFILVALGASYLPARRAMRLEPMVALRQE